mmetsp:Transcript_99734/g.260624  ORF Transcript_99734/g.260624 Transcript_99734/m.260624 type:complete len:294 (-) Transcript_99734:509-1390(-)
MCTDQLAVASRHLATLADVQLYRVALTELDLGEAIVLETYPLQWQDDGAASREDLEARPQNAVGLRHDALCLGSQACATHRDIDARILGRVMDQLRSKEIWDLQAFHALGLEGIEVIPIEELLLDRTLARLERKDLQRMPADLVDIDQAHGIEEVDCDLNAIVHAHRRDVLSRRDTRLVAMEPADILVDPKGARSALLVCVEFEGALVGLVLLSVELVNLRLERTTGLVGVAVRHLRALVLMHVRDPRDEDPIDANTSLCNVNRRPIGARILQMQGGAIVRLESHVDLRKDLV